MTIPDAVPKSEFGVYAYNQGRRELDSGGTCRSAGAAWCMHGEPQKRSCAPHACRDRFARPACSASSWESHMA